MYVNKYNGTGMNINYPIKNITIRKELQMSMIK